MSSDDVIPIRDEISRLRQQIQDLERHRLEDRVARVEEHGVFKVQVAAMETRLATLEDGVKTLMTHSVWLLRLLVGGLIAAAMKFMLEGGLTLA